MDNRTSPMQPKPFHHVPGLSLATIMKEQGIQRTMYSARGRHSQESFLMFLHDIDRLLERNTVDSLADAALMGRAMMVKGCGIRDGQYDMLWVPRTGSIYAVCTSDHAYVCLWQERSPGVHA